MILKTAIYTRVSTEEQAQEGFSIHAQKDKLTKYAELNDWSVYDYYVDDGISGKNLTDRPEVSRLIEDVKMGKVKNVLVYKLDRLTRSVKDLIYLIELFDKYDCTFNSQTEKIDTSNAVGRMFVKIIGIFAEFERENLAERVTFGYEQKTKEGNYTNTNGVYGYDYIPKKQILKVNKLESEYVKKIFNWYLNGESLRSIVSKLETLKVPTKRGGKWSFSTIRSILTNPLYIGNVRYGVNKKNRFETKGKNIKPIIDKELFDDVNEYMKNKRKFKTQKYSSDDTYYYKVLRCPLCGGKYHAKQQLSNGKKYITYFCNNKVEHRCTIPGFSHRKFENAFLEYLDKYDDLEFNEKVLEETNEENKKTDIETLYEEKEKLNKKRKEIINAYSNDEIDFETYKEVANDLVEKVNKIEDFIKTLQKEEKEKNKKTKIDDIKLIITNLKNNFTYLNNKEKKVFIERFIKNIDFELMGDKVIVKNIEF